MAMAITANAAELTAKENAIVDIGAAVARGEQDKLGAAFKAGFDAGLTLNEAKELVGQLYAYCGFPRALNAAGTLMKVQELAAKNAKEISCRDAEAQSDIGYTSQVVLKCRDSKSALYLAAAIVYNGIVPPPDPGGVASGMPYLPGFEMMFLKSLG